MRSSPAYHSPLRNLSIRIPSRYRHHPRPAATDPIRGHENLPERKLAGKVKRKDRAQLNSLAVATRVGGLRRYGNDLAEQVTGTQARAAIGWIDRQAGEGRWSVSDRLAYA